MDITFARVKPYLYILGTVVLLMIVLEQWSANQYDLQALKWHLRHGSEVRCCGIELRVPLKYAQADSPGIILRNWPGSVRRTLFHSPPAVISVDPHIAPKGEYTEVEKQQLGDRIVALQEHHCYKLLTSTQLEMAGRTLSCYEFGCQPQVSRKNHEAYEPPLRVSCWGNDFAVSFDGDKTLRGEFYTMMKEAKAESD